MNNYNLTTNPYYFVHHSVYKSTRIFKQGGYYTASVDDKALLADTLDGIKKLIREAK